MQLNTTCRLQIMRLNFASETMSKTRKRGTRSRAPAIGIGAQRRRRASHTHTHDITAAWARRPRAPGAARGPGCSRPPRRCPASSLRCRCECCPPSGDRPRTLSAARASAARQPRRGARGASPCCPRRWRHRGARPTSCSCPRRCFSPRTRHCPRAPPSGGGSQSGSTCFGEHMLIDSVALTISILTMAILIIWQRLTMAPHTMAILTHRWRGPMTAHDT